jgi:hypothetical protein
MTAPPDPPPSVLSRTHELRLRTPGAGVRVVEVAWSGPESTGTAFLPVPNVCGHGFAVQVVDPGVP